ncbi:MAG: M48 family metallopeptidase [Chloroflexi bacterium]|nr:M48 family metallopeptidase [Chloroflexota bacterium]
MPTVRLGEISIAYTVRVSKRARRVSLRYSPRAGLEVVYPRGISSPPPEALLQEKSAWVLANRERIREASKLLPARAYLNGEVFYVLGEPYTLRLSVDPGTRHTKAICCGKSLALQLPDSPDKADLAARRKAVEACYRALACEYLPARVGELAAVHGFRYQKVRVKNQKTRWGSCSSIGNINLNLRLMMAPEAAIDYVIVHELCHLRVLNHSPAFWLLVESCLPDYRRWRAWFNEHGASLIL